MTELCALLLALLSQLALWSNNLWSWCLANFGDRLPAWWERQVYAVKILVLAGVTVFLGGGGWALGWYGFKCAEFPTLTGALLMIVSAIAGLFIGGKRWENAKRMQAEEKADDLRRELADVELQKLAAWAEIKRLRAELAKA